MTPALPPKIVSFAGSVSGGPKHRDNSLQVVEGTEIVLSWTVTDADGVLLTHRSSGDAKAISGASGTHKHKATEVTEDFTLVAFKDGARSAPAVVHVSTHHAHDAVSHHATVAGPRIEVFLNFQDADLKPRPNVKYTLLPAGADEKTAIKGATNAAGELQVWLDGILKSATLTLHANPDEVYPLVFSSGAPA